MRVTNGPDLPTASGPGATTTAPPPPPDAPPPPEPAGLSRHEVLIGSSLALGSFMVMIDTTVVSVATHALAVRFHASLSTVAWTSTAYLLTLSLVIPLSGWAMERFGGRRVWLAAVVAFCVGSILCGTAWSIGALIAMRVVQGIGGGLIAPVGQALIGRTIGPRQMAKVMALLSVPMMLSPVLGPVLGGLVVDNLDWRWIFYLNLPFGLTAIALVLRNVPAQTPQRSQALDVRGLLLISPGLAALVYGCSEAGAAGGFGAPRVVGSIAAGILLLIVFTVYSLRTKASPLMDLRLMRNRVVGAAMTNGLLLGVGLFGTMFLLPFYFQQARGASALHTGLYLAPQGLGAALASLVAGRVNERMGARALVFGGTLITTLATIPFLLLTADTSIGALEAALVARGVGMGLVLASLFAAAYAPLERSAIPRAATLFNILNRVGGSLGTAVLAVALQRGIADGDLSPSHLAHAYNTAFAWALGLSALALLPAVLLPGPARRATGR